MIGYIFAGLGIVLMVLAILSFKKSWMNVVGRILLVVLTVAVFGASGLSLYQTAKRVQKDKENIYLALRFIEDRESDAALIHLNQVAGTNKDMVFLQSASEILMEGMRDNDTMAALKLRILKETGKYSSDQGDLLSYFEKNELSDDTVLNNAVSLMKDMLKLKEAKETKYASYYEIEYASVCGYNVGGLLEAYEEAYGDDSTAILQLNNNLAGGNKVAALREVCEMVEDNPSAENRLLLAEVIAEMAYDGDTIPDTAFSETISEQTVKELESLQKSYDKNYEKMEKVQAKLEIATDEKKINKLTDQKQKLYEKCEDLMDRMENIYVYRALSSVADINTLEARVVEARLYYSLGEYDKAVEVLVKAADSLAAVFSDNTTLTDGLKLVKKSYSENKGSLSAASEEFSDAVSNVLNINSQGMMAVSFSNLSQDFSQKIVSDLKYEDNNIYVMGFDTSNYPEISVTLGAREEIIADILEHDSIVAKDTRYAVNYTAQVDETTETSICFVVDTSGSMGGTPIANVRTALGSFIKDMETGQEMSLVTFSSDSEIRVPVSTDKAAMQSEVSALGAGGGTDITAGIQMGTQVMESSHGVKTMMMLTDGQSNVDMGVVNQAKDAGITIYTIGFGGVNDEILQQIAEATGGRYVRAESSGELSSVYSSLGSLIGNTVTITYTVTENVEDAPRYFFLRSENYECSVHYDYMETPETEQTMRIDGVSPQLISEGDLAYGVNQNGSYQLNVTGANLDGVSTAYVGDVECVTENYGDTQLIVKIPQFMGEGSYDLRLVDKNGEECVREGAICVYKDGEQLYYQRYRLGSMLFEAYGTVYLASGQMVFSGASMTGIGENDTFHGYTDQLVYVTYDSANDPWLLEDGEAASYIDLGDSGSFTMDGTIYLGSNDPASGNSNNVVMASGKLEGICEKDQSYISPVED